MSRTKASTFSPSCGEVEHGRGQPGEPVGRVDERPAEGAEGHADGQRRDGGVEEAADGRGGVRGGGEPSLERRREGAHAGEHGGARDEVSDQRAEVVVGNALRGHVVTLGGRSGPAGPDPPGATIWEASRPGQGSTGSPWVESISEPDRRRKGAIGSVLRPPDIPLGLEPLSRTPRWARVTRAMP